MKLKGFCGFETDVLYTFSLSVCVCSVHSSPLKKKKTFISTYTQFGEKDKLHI